MRAEERSASDLGAEQRTLSTSNPVIVGLDLAFTDEALETEFVKEHNMSQVFYDVRVVFFVFFT
jgi:hypothetical protein